MEEHLPPAVLAAADELVADFQRTGGAPAVAYGIVAGGALAHTAGYGQRWLDGPAPDAGTVFRIASMTKSFTAAAVLALRDDGALRLDDPVAYLVPELRGMRQVSADSPDITVRHLLTMTAGFPTDDPWGDRQQGLPLADFATLLNRGVRQAWAPGTCFEYSNLGYALLGRVVAAAAGGRYQEFVASRLLGPLGLDRTRYELAGFEPAEVARGYQRGADGWSELVPDGDGAFAPMGGVFSCVRDLASWVTGLAAGFPAGAEADGGPHPLRRASRREMQLPQIAIPPTTVLLPGGGGLGSQFGYGFGLFIEEHLAWGRMVFHGGGYPGFGSHMRWHPASGLAVVVLANSTYAGAHSLAGQLLDALLRAAPARPAGQPLTRGLVPAPGTPWPETIAARHAVDELLRSWDDQAADRIFTPNVAQDEPYAVRRDKAALTWQRLGPAGGAGPSAGRPAESGSPAQLRWWLHGERGNAAVEIKLTPEDPPRVQSLSLAVPPAWDGPLWQRTQEIISLLNASAPDWPADLPVAEQIDTAVLVRQLRTAAAWAGQCQAVAFNSGDGRTSVTVELAGQHARLSLAVQLDQAQRVLRRVDIALLS